MNELEAQEIIKTMDAELETFDRVYEEGRWLKNQGLLSPVDQVDLEARRAAIFLDPKIQAIIETYINSTRDPVFRRLLLVLERLIKYSRVESNSSVYQVRSRIEQAIINYPITIAGKKATRTDARQILRTEKDGKLREAAFHCYDELSHQVQDDLKTLVLLRNSIAQEMGYAHFGVLGLGVQGLTWAQLNEWFDDINVLTESMYRAFLAESTEKLHQDRLHPQDLLYAMTAFKTLPDSYFPSDKLIEFDHLAG